MNMTKKELWKLVKTLKRENERFKRENAKLLLRIEELERRLKLNSSNSSKPPSSDGLRKKPSPKSLREKTNKKFGGQVGHDGNTLKQFSNPDFEIIHEPHVCTACGCSLVDVDFSDEIKRQEIDIRVDRQVVQHKALVKICKCGKRNVGNMPQHLAAPIQYGPNIRALAVYLSTQQFVPKQRAQEFFRDMFQVPISETTLMSFDTECAKRLSQFSSLALDKIKKSEVSHFDETGYRIKGKTWWAHVASTEKLTFYTVNKKRGLRHKGFSGTIVHDFWKPYFTMENVNHALCNAHILRELKAVNDIDKEEWAGRMFDLLQKASKYHNPSIEKINQVEKSYDEIVEEALFIHERLGPPVNGSRKKRVGHNLLLRLQKYKTDILRFLSDPSVPFTNNLAERDLRMVKVKQKISGCFRTEEGAHDFLQIRAFISSAKKQVKNVFNALLDVMTGSSFDCTSFIPD
jgi:transposase